MESVVESVVEYVIAKRKDLPAEVAAWPVERRLAWLDGEAAAATLTASARRRIRRELRAACSRESRLLARQAEAARVALLVWCCSGYWAELCQAYLEAKGLLSTSEESNRRHCGRAGLYPQPGHRVCPGCRRPTPPNNFGSLGRWRELCDDCVAGELEGVRSGLELPEESVPPPRVRRVF